MDFAMGLRDMITPLRWIRNRGRRDTKAAAFRTWEGVTKSPSFYVLHLEMFVERTPLRIFLLAQEEAGRLL